MRLHQLLVITLLLASRGSLAQTGPAVVQPPTRWAVGGQGALYPRIALADVPASQGGAAYARPWPIMLTVRYRTRLRAAVEAGVLLRLEPARTLTEANSMGTYILRARAATWAVPLLARVQIAPLKSKHWQLDAEVGLMPLSMKYIEETTFVDAQTGQGQVLGNSRQSYSDVPLLLGLGGTYHLTEHFNLTADARLTWSYLLTIVGKILLRRDDYVSPFTPALSAGVGYQFGSTH